MALRNPGEPGIPAEPAASSSIPGGRVAGAEVIRELPPDVALPVWQVLRGVLLWAAEGPVSRAGLYEREPIDEWEEALLLDTFDPALRNPLAVIVAELGTPPAAAAPGRVSWACVCVADWALAQKATHTALAFAQAAAMASPGHPRYAWLAARLLRSHGRLDEATEWFQETVRMGTRNSDWEAQTRGLIGLGNTLLEQGDYRHSARAHQGALRTARRRRLRACEGDALHDLFVVHYAMGDWGHAEEYARAAFEIYRETGNERLPTLAHDIAFLWMNRGYFARALPVFQAVAPAFTDPGDRLRTAASAARAAGVCAEREVFEQSWTEAAAIIAEFGTDPRLKAVPLVEMAMGAASLGEWDRAEKMLEHALEVAARRNERDVAVRAESTLAAVRSQRRPDRPAEPTRPDSAGDTLARQMIRALAGTGRG